MFAATAAASISGVTFRERLAREFDERRARNPRYSLRAFAKSIGEDHSSLSRILRGRRHLSTRTITRIGHRLGLTAAEITESCSASNDAAVLAAISRASFRAESRWIAAITGIALDEVNISLQRLIYNGALVMASRTEWRRG